eukprot:2614852-Prorocentrum_lima.AAC.1
MSGTSASRLPPPSSGTNPMGKAAPAVFNAARQTSPPPRAMKAIKERVCVEPESAATEGLLIKSPPTDRPP